MEKEAALRLAKELIGVGDAVALRQAALELRRCLEAVVYEKLWAYRDRIPASVARKWQPPQAFRALLFLEPNAGRTATYRFAEEPTAGATPTGPWRSLGTDHRPEPGWLTRTWNKLGSFLHAKWPFARDQAVPSLEETREYLQQVARELEPFVERTFTSTLGVVATFTCVECGAIVKANAEGLVQAGEVECLDPDCGCLYSVKQDGDEVVCILDAKHLPCSRCGADIRLPCHRLALDFAFACPSCAARFKIVEQTWSIRCLEPSPTPPPSGSARSEGEDSPIQDNDVT